jgi:hypothetical protein
LGLPSTGSCQHPSDGSTRARGRAAVSGCLRRCCRFFSVASQLLLKHLLSRSSTVLFD